ncbi:hypothetical protein [Arthrobacter methylotrophus]|uniref:hypothetical protein n=1 Tax=Arthrobacter methylotrophus TaxID=121291 RepID=UPI0031EAD4E0
MERPGEEPVSDAPLTVAAVHDPEHLSGVQIDDGAHPWRGINVWRCQGRGVQSPLDRHHEAPNEEEATAPVLPTRSR